MYSSLEKFSNSSSKLICVFNSIVVPIDVSLLDRPVLWSRTDPVGIVTPQGSTGKIM